MPIYKCRMCENEIEDSEGQSLCVCRFCGTSQTLPASISDKIISVFNRANHLRQQCEFNKATSLYEELLKHTDNDPEIYWQLTLCRYGIKYINESQINIMVPDCRRARYRSILCDPFFLMAMNTEDSSRSSAYRKEAEYIDVMQKKLLGHVAQQYTDNMKPEEAELSPDELIVQGRLCLSNKKWAAADAYFSRASNISPQSSEAYFGKLLVECELDSPDKIPDIDYDLSFSSNYRTALRLGNKELEELTRKSMLNRGTRLLKSAKSLAELSMARELLSQCQDTDSLLNECTVKMDELKEEYYQKACRLAEESTSLEETKTAMNIFIELENYKDSPVRVQECGELMLTNNYDSENAYRKAVSLIASAEFHSDYDTACDILKSLEEYKNSPALLKKCIRKRRFLSLSVLVKLAFIASVCYAVPIIIEKI
ncbi:MAG: hypothetical protein IKK47_01625 [Ruminococcus sp.]|nr:hypothetical protein [Ruminococcus sp.]